jgi:UMF1 family MFS transporter
MHTRRAQRVGWYLYDWGHSAFTTTTITVFLGPYLTTVAEAGAGPDGLIHPLGLAMNPRSWFPYMVSLSVILQVFILPAIGAIADHTHRKKFFFGLFALAGATFASLLFFLSATKGNYLMGGLTFVLANLCFGVGVVLYNAFLNDIAEPEERDAVSSRGFAWGYLGGGLLLALNLWQFSTAADADKDIVVRFILLQAGLWWAVFTLPALVTLPGARGTGARGTGDGGTGDGGTGDAGRVAMHATVKRSFSQLWQTFRHMAGYPQTLQFLVAYLLYNDAVQTVIVMAAPYGQEELHLDQSVLITAILLVQFVGMAGAMLFERLARMFGAKRALVVAVTLWTVVCVVAYGAIHTEREFFILAVLIAIVLGGTQALSRSLYSVFIPVGKEAEYFSVYEISDKGTSWLGPLVFGLALDLTNSYRVAILSLIVFFVVGLVLLLRVNVQRAIADASHEPTNT